MRSNRSASIGAISQLASQPPPRYGPVEFDGARRDVEHVRDFLRRHAAEDARLHDVRGAGIESGETLERFVQGEHFEGGGGAVARGVVERHALHAIEPLARPTATSVIDQNLPHRAAGNVEKVRSVGPRDARLIDKFQPGVVHELGRLQGMSRPLPPHERARDASQLRVRGIKDRLQRRGRTSARIGQQAREVGRRRIRQKASVGQSGREKRWLTVARGSEGPRWNSGRPGHPHTMAIAA